MKRQIKVNAVLFMLGALSILSFKSNAGDTTKVYKNIVVEVGNIADELESNAIAAIRSASNDMFAADFVTVVYSNERDKNAQTNLAIYY